MQSKIVANFIREHAHRPEVLEGLAQILSGENTEWVIELALKQYEYQLKVEADEAVLNTPSDVIAHLDPIDEPVMLITTEVKPVGNSVDADKVAHVKKVMLARIKLAHERFEKALSKKVKSDKLEAFENSRNDLIAQYKRMFGENVQL
jgi:nitrogen fixation/metabolism regulation signal transduction histidine kinase